MYDIEMCCELNLSSPRVNATPCPNHHQQVLKSELWGGGRAYTHVIDEHDKIALL